jgi:hypothetical protein
MLDEGFIVKCDPMAGTIAVGPRLAVLPDREVLCSWMRHSAMLRFNDPNSSGAEAWVVELSDGRLLGTCWHVSHHGGEFPNAFAISQSSIASRPSL